MDLFEGIKEGVLARDDIINIIDTVLTSRRVIFQVQTIYGVIELEIQSKNKLDYSMNAKLLD